MEFETWEKIEFINSPKIVGIPVGEYEISSHGNLRQVLSDNIRKKVKINTTSDQRPRYGFTLDNGKRVMPFIHQLVAQAFIPNPEGLPNVKHIDGNKSNNYVGNLRWSK
ncbi:HNH endonuclease [Lactococcus lactis]|uniref:HNH endonuclease n=1 Tax=Lactococcus lactis TaxID=1358 RepID=UPI00204812B9|nr:HNH endonuclease [Lactococcus lactis]BDH82568.1 hypothetical protein LLL8_22250 [Lactococcus lactis]